MLAPASSRTQKIFLNLHMRNSPARAPCYSPLLPLIHKGFTYMRTSSTNCVLRVAHVCANLHNSSYERTKSTRKSNQNHPKIQGNHAGHPGYRSRLHPFTPSQDRKRRASAKRHSLACHMQVPRHLRRGRDIRGGNSHSRIRPCTRTDGTQPPQQSDGVSVKQQRES